MHLLGRPGDITATELALVTGGAEAPYSPYGVHLEPGSGDIGELDVIREGLAIVQDEGSQLVGLACVRAPVSGADAAVARSVRRAGARPAARSLPPSTGPPSDAVEINEHADLVLGPSTGCR